MKNVVLILIALFGLFVGNAAALNAAPPKTQSVTIQTSAVCGMCEETISKALIKEKGVKSVSMNIDTKAVVVTYNPKFTSPDKIRTAISMSGYDADAVPADAKAYDSLHACCKKDAKH